MNAFSLRSMVLAVAVVCATTASSAEEIHHSHRLLQASNFHAAMLQAVNAERAKQGLAAFCTNSKLQTAAQLHSEDQAKNNMMSHTGSNGSQMSSRITAQGFKWNGVAENVAAGQRDVASVMQSWMNSSGHKANILGNYKFFGMGYAYDADSNYGHYWTQDFASGSSEQCDGGSSATPASTTSAPKTSPPVYTSAPTTSPPVYTSAPATKGPTAPATTAPVVTSTPATRSPTSQSQYGKKPRKSRKQKKTKTRSADCKPIY
uniref:SCP domain-containing protein n=1 Tax=Globisporangium ultimum (strain ATCC 200006 / CBS 805.95 / DAOM BR144) TaxID=431595 RepID=K3WIC0_GLOUD